MNVLDLFSGIGGFSLGLERAGFKTVAFCECEPYCQAVLKKHWPNVPCFDDVRTLTKQKLVAHGIEAIDIICGGYPCQPFSSAGKRRGQEDDRHLWPEFARLIREIRPAWVIGENVAGHISMGLDDVLTDLENEGYQARAFVIPACAVGAPHRRDRVWTVAYANSGADGGVTRKYEIAGGEERLQERHQDRQLGQSSDLRTVVADTETERAAGGSDVLANANYSYAQRLKRQSNDEAKRQESHKGQTGLHCRAGDYCQWAPEPAVGRVAHGIPARVDRLKCLGNAVVPQIPEIIGRAIKESCLM